MPHPNMISTPQILFQYEMSPSVACANDPWESYEVKTGTSAQLFSILYDMPPPKGWQFALDEVQGKYRKMAREYCAREVTTRHLTEQSGPDDLSPDTPWTPFSSPRVGVLGQRLPIPNWATSLLSSVFGVDPRAGLKVVEDLAVLISGISIATSRAHVRYAIIVYLKLRLGDRSIIEFWYNSIIRMFYYVFGPIYGLAEPNQLRDAYLFPGGVNLKVPRKWTEYPLTLQNGDSDEEPMFEQLIRGTRQILNCYSDCKNSDLYKKSYKFFMYILSSSILDGVGVTFDTFQFTQLQAEAIRSKYHIGPNFVYVCLDTLVFICERGIQYVRTRDMSSFFHSGRFYEEWAVRAQEVKNQYVHFHNLEAAGTNYFDFMSRLNKVVSDAEEMTRMCKRSGREESTFMRRLQQEMVAIKLDVASKEKALESRKAPFAVVVFGGTSVAKSLFSRTLVSMYCNAFGLPLGDEHVYVRNPIDPYWVNFMTSMHTIILDDIAFMHPNIAQQGDPTVMEALQINNNVPFVPVQAALEDKGRTPLRCELLIATTNDRTLHAQKYFTCPGAVLRRFPWVFDLEVKKEYAKENGMLDSLKVEELSPDDPKHLDIWDIVVYEVIPVVAGNMGPVEARTNTTATWKKRFTFTNISDLCAWFVETAEVYRNIQDKAEGAMKVIKQVKLCMGRKVPSCNCADVRCEHFKRGCYRPMTACDHSHEGCLPLETQSGADTFWDEPEPEPYGPDGDLYPEWYCPSCGWPEKWCICDIYGTCSECWQRYEECMCGEVHIEDLCPVCEFSFHECICAEPLDETLCYHCEFPRSECICGFIPQAGSLELRDNSLAKEDPLDVAFTEHVRDLAASPIAEPDISGEIGSLHNPYSVNLRSEIMEKYYDAFRNKMEEKQEHKPRYSSRNALREVWKWNWIVCIRLSFWLFILRFYWMLPRWGRVVIDWILGQHWMANTASTFIGHPKMWVIGAKLIGSHIEDRIIRQPFKIKLFLAGLCTLSTSLAGYALLRKLFSGKKEQVGLADSIGEAPQPLNADRVRPNVWYKDDYQTTSFDVGLRTRSWTTMPRAELEEKLRANCVHIRFVWRKNDAAEATVPNCGFVVCGNILVTNAHAIPAADTFSMHVTRVRKGPGITENVTVKCTRSEMFINGELDLAFIQMLDIPPFADLRDLLARDTLRGNHKGFYLGRKEDANMLNCNVVNINAGRVTHSVAENPGIARAQQIDTLMWRGRTEVPMTKGSCGSVLISMSAMGPIILGIHALSSTWDPYECYAVSLTREAVDAAMASFTVVNAGVPQINAASTAHVLGALHPKSPFRYIEQGIASVYGSILGFRPSPRSRVVKRIIGDSLLSRGYELKHGAPIMKGWGPKRNALLAMVDPVSKFDPDILNEAAECYLADLKLGIDQADLEKLGVVDMRTSVNGAAGMPHVEHINRSTSAGFPWFKTKKQFLEADEIQDDGLADPVRPNAEIKERIEDCLETYMRGERWNPIFCANLKDEATKFEKIKTQKTRVFAGAPFPWIVVGRMFFLLLLRLIYTYQYVFEAAPGISATSIEWTSFYNHITCFGKDRMIAGDFKNFDKTMSARVILKSFWIYIQLAIYSGKYAKAAILAMWCIAYDIAFPWMYFFGDLVQFWGTNPSGHFMTVQVNSTANSLYMRYVYAVLSPERSAKNFKKHVCLMTYGDDNIMSVHPDAPWFNHTSIAEVLATLGIEYTMADKTAESKPYVHIDECTFLKRSFRFDEEIGAVMAPLDTASIDKSLLIGVVSRSITPEAQSVDCVASAVRAAFHHGRPYFNKVTTDCKAAILENDLGAYVAESTFPTYEALIKAFWEGKLTDLPPEVEVELRED